MSRPRPLAIAVLWVPPRTAATERQRLRYELAQAVNEEGYALLDLFEVGGTAGESGVYDTVSARAGRGDVQALVVHGTVDRRRLDGIADRHRLRVVESRATGFCRSAGGRTDRNP